MKLFMSVLLLISGTVLANGYGRLDERMGEEKLLKEETRSEKVYDEGITITPQERQEEKMDNADLDPELDPINDDMTHDEGIYDD